MKSRILLLLLLCLVLPLWGEYYYQDDPEILALIHLSRRMGKVQPFSSFPVHGSDILDFADSLLYLPAAKNLNEADRSMLEDLIDGLEKQKEEEIIIRGGLATAYEHRFSSREVLFGEREMPNFEDVRRAYLNFSPVISLSAASGTFNGIWIGAQFDIRPSWEDDYDPMNNFFTKVDIAYDLVKRGIFAWNGSYLNVFFGRDTVHWGNPQGSSFYPSALLPFLDSLRMNVPLGPFSFDYMLGTIMPKRSRFRDVGDAARKYFPDATPKNPLGPYFGYMNDDSEQNPSVILLAAHRFQWNFGRIKAGIGGTIVYARANNQFLITDILPVIIYHNSDSVPNNLSMMLDAEWTIIPGLSLSVMMGFDDINAKSVGIPDDGIPTIPGALLQLEYSAGNNKFFQSYTLEAGYTHYLWGNFAYKGPDIWCGVYLARAIYRYTPNKYAVLLPLTSPYGPGALWGKFNGSVIFPDRHIKAGAELLFLAKNSRVNLVDTPYLADDSLNSFDQFYFTLDIPLSYTWRNLEFSISPALLCGTGGTAIECTLGMRWSLEGTRSFSVHRKK